MRSILDWPYRNHFHGKCLGDVLANALKELTFLVHDGLILGDVRNPPPSLSGNLKPVVSDPFHELFTNCEIDSPSQSGLEPELKTEKRLLVLPNLFKLSPVPG